MVLLNLDLLKKRLRRPLAIKGTNLLTSKSACIFSGTMANIQTTIFRI
jgi:hypothetical protein